MKIIKYYKDNCPGCESVTNYCKEQEYKFDAEVNAMNDISSIERKKLRIMAAPTVILFDDDGKEIDRISGYDAEKLDLLFDERYS
jgi:thioredoxin-related protein